MRIILSNRYGLLQRKLNIRGAAMTEYTIILAFVAVVAGIVFSTEWDYAAPGESGVVEKNLYTAICASVSKTIFTIMQIISGS